MAKSALERKREQVQRDREALRMMEDSTYPFLKTPFYEWKEGNTEWESAEFNFHAAGFEAPSIDDDRGPSSIDGEVELIADASYHPYAGYKGSIGRAEALVDYLIAAASNVALAINTYKKEELTARIKEIETSDLSKSDARDKALRDIVQLRKMLERLDKTNRVTMHEHKVKGI